MNILILVLKELSRLIWHGAGIALQLLMVAYVVEHFSDSLWVHLDRFAISARSWYIALGIMGIGVLAIFFLRKQKYFKFPY
jgi:hypothetical protein